MTSLSLRNMFVTLTTRPGATSHRISHAVRGFLAERILPSPPPPHQELNVVDAEVDGVVHDTIHAALYDSIGPERWFEYD